eukprot:2902735-Amphidinium_carterae.1
MSAALTFKSHPPVVSGLITVYPVDSWLTLDSRRPEEVVNNMVNLLGSPSGQQETAEEVVNNM